MKFCRNCGSALAPIAALPGFGAAPPGGMPASMAALGGPMPGMPSGPIGGFPSAPPGGLPPYGGPLGGGPLGSGPLGGLSSGPLSGISSGPLGGGPISSGPLGGGPIGGLPAMAREALDATMLPPAPVPALTPGGGSAARAAQGSTIACPRCGTQTPLGFAYCQQCGLNLQAQALASTEAAPGPSQRGPAPALGAKLDGPIDPHAGTLAQDDAPAAAAAARTSASVVRPQTGPGWGTAVLVNRDGSDGQRYALSGEYLVVGRAGADIAFDDDRFLARQHARIERGGDGVVKIRSLDTLNGVFRKADAPVDLVDGTTILIGREVLRYERVDPEEVKLFPLVRHGVALFGSPPREPWGRLVQIVPSGGYRDVRHLIGDEVVLGREEGDIVFRDDAFLSRRHAAVTWDGKRAQITDLGSSNGTFVRIPGPTALRHGDHVRMGDQLLRIELGR